MYICIYIERERVDSKKLEHGCRIIFAGCSSVFGLRLDGGDVPSFWLLLQSFL